MTALPAPAWFASGHLYESRTNHRDPSRHQVIRIKKLHLKRWAHPGKRGVGFRRLRLRLRTRTRIQAAAAAFSDSGSGRERRSATAIRGSGSDRRLELPRVAAAHHRCCHLPRTPVAVPVPAAAAGRFTLAFGYRMAAPGTAADAAISCSDSISTVAGTASGVWKDPLDFSAPIPLPRSPRLPPLTLFGPQSQIFQR